MEERSQK